MNEHERISQFITLLRGNQATFDGADANDTSFHIMIEIFSKGNCGNFAAALQVAFGGDLALVDSGAHVVLRYCGRLYDIHGDVTAKYEHYYPIDYNHLEERDYIDNYSFAERGPIC